MVALAPNTSETSPWDILDGFPKLHSRAREAFTSSCTEAPDSKSLGRVEIWLMIYDYRDGLESFTRDPIGYEDGENLFQYVGSNPLLRLDPSGNKCCVLYWDSGNSTGSGSGHVALKCGPDADRWPSASDYYSFGAGPTESDDRLPPRGRAPSKTACFDCPLDETKIRNAWTSSLCDRRFGHLGQNCSTTLAQLIQAGMPSCPPFVCPCGTEYQCKDKCGGFFNNNGPPGIDMPSTAWDYAVCVGKNKCSSMKSYCSPKLSSDFEGGI